jgi:hypothetical protein
MLARLQYPYRFTLLLAAALLVGVMVSYQPVLSMLAATALCIMFLCLYKPEWVSYLVLLSTSVSINLVFPDVSVGMELLSVYKMGMLLLLAPCMLLYGLRLKFGSPILALLVMLMITFSFSNWLPGYGMGIAIKAFIGLAIPFVILMIKWEQKVADVHLKLLCILPLVSILAGLVLEGLHFYPFLSVEFTGAVRVQGANIPPHLAMLAVLGMMIALMETRRKADSKTYFMVMMVINFAILVATGTRGPLLAALALLVCYAADIIRNYVKGQSKLFVPIAAGGAVVMLAAYLQWDNMKKRSFERSTDTGIDLSDRNIAWEFFLKKVEDYPWSGRGLGSATIANDGSLYQGFVVPHNEYIRFYFDSGYIGCALLFLTLFLVFGMVYRVLPRQLKPYYLAFILGFLIYSFSDNTLSTVQFIIPFCWYLNVLYTVSRDPDSP